MLLFLLQQMIFDYVSRAFTLCKYHVLDVMMRLCQSVNAFLSVHGEKRLQDITMKKTRGSRWRMEKAYLFGYDRRRRSVPLAGVSLLMVLFLAVNMLLPAAEVFAPQAAHAEGAVGKPLEGLTISIMGDSISTYDGWSDKYPIAGEEYAHRYGEPYYGPAGTDHHNTDMLVTDTWWHQAAEELGMDVLMSNAGNSTGLLWATYPYNADWDQYLKDLLMYKSRPYYLGRDGKAPDVIALYVGSSDARQYKDYGYSYGSIADINFANLIQKNGSVYTYATPATVAEAYSILLHKISVTYPNAEVYCFAVVPQSGSTLNAVNRNMPGVIAFNKMVYDVAGYWGAHVVDLFQGYGLDADGDGLLTQNECDKFRKYYHDDPHPNASGFDKITDIFVDTVLKNTRYTAEVETYAGIYEYVPLKAQEQTNGDTSMILTKAENYLTPNGLLVNYSGIKEEMPGGKRFAEAEWTSEKDAGGYTAQGGMESEEERYFLTSELSISLFDQDAPQTDRDETLASVSENGIAQTICEGSPKTAPNDGIYDYTETSVSNTASVSIRTKEISAIEGPAMMVVDKGMEHYVNVNHATGTNDMLSVKRMSNIPDGPEDMPEFTEGYDYLYIGSDQFSKYSSAHAHTYRSEDAPNEQPVYVNEKDGYSLYVLVGDHSVFRSRGLTVPRLYFQDGTVVESESRIPLRYDFVQNFTIANRLGQIATTYCADKDTPAEIGYAYKMYI